MSYNGQVIKNNMIEGTAAGIAKEEDPPYKTLQESAKVFLNGVQELIEGTKINNRTDMLKNISKGSILELEKRMAKSNQNTQTALGYQHVFEEQLNVFFGRTIYLTYVTDDGNINYYNEATIGRLYRERARAGSGKGKFNKSIINEKKMNDGSISEGFETKDLQEELKERLEKSQMDKQFVYVTALQRYNNTTSKPEDYHYNFPEKTFYWHYSSTYLGHTEKINNRGDISEWYVDAVVNEDRNITENYLERSLQELWKRYGKGKRDIAYGIIKGDITLKTDGSIQFAVKYGEFDSAKIGQFVRMAYNILQLKSFTKEELEKNLSSISRYMYNTDKLEQYFKDVATEEAKEEISFKT